MSEPYLEAVVKDVERALKELQDVGVIKITEDGEVRLTEKGKLYNKIEHGKRISRKMVEFGHVPEDVKQILLEIVEKFDIR